MQIQQLDEQKLEPLVTAKQVKLSGLIPCSTVQLLSLAKRGLVPCYPIPGTGKRVNWWFKIKELYEYFTKNGGQIVANMGDINSGHNSISIRKKEMGRRLLREWR